MTHRLEETTFKAIVASTPLVSIDLIIRNSTGRVLLGLRNNRPAKGYWFVPGGRIFKNETFEQAFQRLGQVELGITTVDLTPSFLGAYQHFYEDNFSGSDFSTHYVVLGYQIELDIPLSQLPHEQHENYQWWSVSELLNSKSVHSNTKAYFSEAYR